MSLPDLIPTFVSCLLTFLSYFSLGFFVDFARAAHIQPNPFSSCLPRLQLRRSWNFPGWTGCRRAEARFSDRFVSRPGSKIRPDPDIVVIAADEASLERMADYAGRWPWPRSVHGELVEGISAQKPRAIVFDIMFFEPDIYPAGCRRTVQQDGCDAMRMFIFPTVRQDPAGDRIWCADRGDAGERSAPLPGRRPTRKLR